MIVWDLIKKVSLKQVREKVRGFQAEYTAEEETLRSPAGLEHVSEREGE